MSRISVRSSGSLHGSRDQMNPNNQRQSIDAVVNYTNNNRSVNRPSLGRRQPSETRPTPGEGFGGNDGGFLSMSRFAQMSFEEARTNLHPSVRNSMARPAQLM